MHGRESGAAPGFGSAIDATPAPQPGCFRDNIHEEYIEFAQAIAHYPARHGPVTPNRGRILPKKRRGAQKLRDLSLQLS